MSFSLLLITDLAGLIIDTLERLESRERAEYLLYFDTTETLSSASSLMPNYVTDFFITILSRLPSCGDSSAKFSLAAYGAFLYGFTISLLTFENTSYGFFYMFTMMLVVSEWSATIASSSGNALNALLLSLSVGGEIGVIVFDSFYVLAAEKLRFI